MNHLPLRAADLARRVIAHEANGRDGPEELVPAAARALRKLRQDLARLLGTDGFSALEARAVELARRAHPILGPDGTGEIRGRALDEARAELSGRDPAEGGEALQAVCAHLIGLLFMFLGEQLTSHLIHLAWPDLPGEEPDGSEKERP